MNDDDQPPSTMLSYLRLLRIPNVFTAVADVLMGFLVVERTYEPAGPLAVLVLSSVCLYLAGMVLNDVFDAEVDAVERPERPIPSGAVSIGVARVLGYALLVGGVALAAVASTMIQHAAPVGVAVFLANAILGYNRGLKNTILGPVSMGSCRFLNVLLGMSIGFEFWDGMTWAIASGVGLYVVGITIFAKNEAGTSGRYGLISGLALMLAGIGLIAFAPHFVSEAREWILAGTPEPLKYLWMLLAAQIAWRGGRAVTIGTPQAVQGAVKTAILSIIVIDAAAAVPCAAVNVFPMVIAALLIPAYALGRWVYST